MIKQRLLKLQLLLFLLVVSNAVFAQNYNYYYGNIHCHTGYSDGSKDGDVSGITTPSQAFAFAKESEHLDFLGISEHNHSLAGMDKPNYHKGVAQANSANEDGKFVCLYGMEFGTVANGHVLIYGLDKLINWETDNTDIPCEKGDYGELWDILNANPGCFATLAHPKTENFSELLRSPHSDPADGVVCGTAIRNGPHSSHSVNYDDPPGSSYYSYYKSMLAAGYRLGPTIDHDNHYTTFGRHSSGRTVVLAKSLTRKNITDAYKAMRFYASDDWNTKVAYTIDDKTMGEDLRASSVVLAVDISDEDVSDKVTTVKVMYGTVGSGEQPTALINEETGQFSYTVEILPDEDIYICLDITQNDGDKIFTAPIWVRGSNVP